MILHLLTFSAGLVVGGAFVGAGVWATMAPAVHAARMRAYAAEAYVQVLLLDRKAK